jgi:ABC-type multidrug transport system fused ATPase/permease subunit
VFGFFEKLIPPFPEDPALSGAPPHTFFRFIFFYSRGIWRYLLLVSFLSALAGFGEALFFYYIGSLVDILAETEPAALWEKHRGTFITFGIISLAALPLIQTAHHLLLNQGIRSSYPMQIRYRMHCHLLRQSVSFFASEYAGRLSQKLMQTSLGIRDTVLKFIDVIVHMIVYFVTMVFMLAETNAILMSIMLFWLFLYLGIMYHYLPLLRRASRAAAEKRSEMVGCLVDSYANIQTVKLFSKGAYEEQHAAGNMKSCLRAEYLLMRLVTRFDLSVQYIDYLLIAALTFMSVWLWQQGVILAGGVAVALSLAIRINNMSQWVMWEVGLLFDNIGNVQNGMDTVARPVAVTDPANPAVMDSCRGEITFRNVDFAYTPGVPVFKNLCLTIKPGERIGLVGHSGSGKSTLVNLLLRFYDVNSGAVLVDGADVRTLKQDDLRSMIAMVTQDISLLHRSVRDNIMYGYDYSENSENVMREAAHKAEADDFIVNLSDAMGHQGYDTQVGERGVRLSGGQRQRIAIARVIIRNSPILILDEATSALDSEIEDIVKKNLEGIMQGKTVIAIAHRLSTIAAMDRLIVLEHGVIAEEGTHEELLEKNGIYASMWHKQTGGFLGE